MDFLTLLRTVGGLGTVLGILTGALWLVRRYDLRLPGRTLAAHDRRLELVETLPIDARRTVALVRRDGREHLVLVAPEGHLIIESTVLRDEVDVAADEARRAARFEAEILRDEQRRQQRELQAARTARSAEYIAGLATRTRLHAERSGPALKAIADGGVRFARLLLRDPRMEAETHAKAATAELVVKPAARRARAPRPASTNPRRPARSRASKGETGVA